VTKNRAYGGGIIDAGRLQRTRNTRLETCKADNQMQQTTLYFG
jgi:hypothetical protein